MTGIASRFWRKRSEPDVKYFSWIITLPITLFVVVFALSNMHEVTFGLWPLDDTFTLELYIAVLLTFLVGFICGGIVLWFSAGKVRRRARKAEFEAVGLKQENANLKHQISRDAAERAHRGNTSATGEAVPLQIGAKVPQSSQAPMGAASGSGSPPARLAGSP